MRCISKVWHISAYQIRKAFRTRRIIIVYMLLACFHFENLAPVSAFSHAVGIPVTPYAFVHMVNDFIYQLVIMAGVIVLFCDAPFEDESYYYRLPRAGTKGWAFGQILYIMVMAGIYELFLIAMSVVPLAGQLDFSGEWGKIWGTLAKTNAGVQFGQLFSVTDYIVSKYQPMEALFLSIALEWACIVWIGLLIYFFNKLTERPAGTFTGAFFVLLDICIANDWMNWANRFSPITLAQLTAYTGYNLQYHITLLYGTVFFAAGIGVLICLCVSANEKARIADGLSGRLWSRRYDNKAGN